MTTTAPTGSRPRRGRPRHHESPRTRGRGGREAARADETPAVLATQLTSVVEIDLTGVAAEDVLTTVAVAAVRAAAAHPAVVRSRGVHLGVLAPDGSTSAVVEHADELTAAALAARIDAGHRTAGDRTLDVLDTGSRGVLVDTPAVGPGRTPVVGIGSVVRRPVVRSAEGGEVIVVRAMAHVSLSYDSALGGSEAADFLRAVRHAVEEGTA